MTTFFSCMLSNTVLTPDIPGVYEPTTPQMRADLQAWKARYPFVGQFELGIRGVGSVFSNPKLVKNDLPIVKALPVNPSEVDWMLRFIGIVEQFVELYRLMAALLNDLIVGRQQLDRSLQGKLPPVFRLRPGHAFYRSEGITMETANKDLTSQARAYSYETKWLETTMLKWHQAVETWRVKNRFPVCVPEYDHHSEDTRAKERRPKTTQVAMEKVPSRNGGKRKLDLEKIASQLLNDDTEKALITSYLTRFKSFSDEWDRVLIYWPMSGPTRTLLAYTSNNAKVLSSLLRLGKKLAKSSAEVERILYRFAKGKTITNDDAVILPMNGFLGDDPNKAFKNNDPGKCYRDQLLSSLGSRKGFHLSLMPLLLQRWQTDSLERAVLALNHAEKGMKAWLKDHPDDPVKQGIHLAQEE